MKGNYPNSIVEFKRIQTEFNCYIMNLEFIFRHKKILSLDSSQDCHRPEKLEKPGKVREIKIGHGKPGKM